MSNIYESAPEKTDNPIKSENASFCKLLKVGLKLSKGAPYKQQTMVVMANSATHCNYHVK